MPLLPCQAGGYDIDLEGALASGHVGSPVQPADRALLRLRPLRHYAAGELVAVKRRSNTPAAASSAAAAADGGEAEGVTLCYGRVAVDAAPAAGQAAYRLSVEVEPGVYETLLSTQVREPHYYGCLYNWLSFCCSQSRRCCQHRSVCGGAQLHEAVQGQLYFCAACAWNARPRKCTCKCALAKVCCAW
jgi:hypothetical protein